MLLFTNAGFSVEVRAAFLVGIHWGFKSGDALHKGGKAGGRRASGPPESSVEHVLRCLLTELGTHVTDVDEHGADAALSVQTPTKVLSTTSATFSAKQRTVPCSLPKHSANTT